MPTEPDKKLWPITVTGKNGKKIIGKIVHRIPAEVYNVKTKKTYKAFQLVILTHELKLHITPAMRPAMRKPTKKPVLLEDGMIDLDP